jgi:hypothetical protein
MSCGVHSSRIYSGEYLKRFRIVLYIETDEKRMENAILLGPAQGCHRSWKCRNVFSVLLLLLLLLLFLLLLMIL